MAISAVNEISSAEAAPPLPHSALLWCVVFSNLFIKKKILPSSSAVFLFLLWPTWLFQLVRFFHPGRGGGGGSQQRRLASPQDNRGWNYCAVIKDKMVARLLKCYDVRRERSKHYPQSPWAGLCGESEWFWWRYGFDLEPCSDQPELCRIGSILFF